MDITTTVTQSFHHSLPETEKFRQAANNNPSVNRFVLNAHDSSVIARPLGFISMPFRFIFGRDAQETEENKKILTNFKKALIKQYGEKITAYAFPSLESRIQEGSRLDASTIKQVFSDADLLASLFVNEEIAPLLEAAVKADAKAVLRVAEAHSAVNDSAAKAGPAKEATQKSDELIAAVNLAFDKALQERKEELDARAEEALADGSSIDISGQDIYEIIRDPLNDPQTRNLTTLKKAWFAWAHEAAFERHDEESDPNILDFFQQQLESITPGQGDRLVLDADNATIRTAPRSFLGRSLQWIRGRGDQEMEENRAIVQHFQMALTARYGPIMAHFAFPTAGSRIERGSRLDKATVEKSLRLAGDAEKLLEKIGPDIMNDAMSAYGNAVAKKREAEKASLLVKTTAIEAVKANKEAETAYNKADLAVIRFLKTKAEEEKTDVIVKTATELRDLWFEEAKRHFTRDIPVAELIDDSDFTPSAPLAPLDFIPFSPLVTATAVYAKTANTVPSAPPLPPGKGN